ncbi:hypothetical protein PENTCL1PPCAC_30634, partial [Pristionchus entomophagus]
RVPRMHHPPWLTPLILLCLSLSTALYGYGFLLADLQRNNAAGKEGSGGKETHSDCPLSSSSIPRRRNVLMVIDAWKWGFLTEFEDMEYVRSSIDSGSAAVLRARVQTPTVTMPRIKALTSGSVPSFASVLLNFHSTATVEESWPRAVKESGRSLVFYGDDTWLNLFPDVFEKRSEGVVSFYVTDYTQVDDNVTRHIDAEFSLNEIKDQESKAADVLIIHYLGLDHIGHSLGGESEKIPGKLKEMDGIVRRIHEALINSGDSFLFTILGDHGMTKAGNHGGSSSDETQVPVVVYRSEKGEEEGGSRTNLSVPLTIEQLDVASFLSHELGVEVPSDSLGVTYHHRIGFDVSLSIIAIMRDVRRLSEKVPDGERKDSLISCVHSLSSLLGANCILRDRKEWRETVERCYEQAREVQNSLISSASQMDGVSMIIAIGGTSGIVLYLLHSFLSSSSIDNLSPSSFLSLPIHLLSFFASSLVEEEHDVWYFLLSSSLFVELFRSLRKGEKGRSLFAPLSSLLLHRMAISLTMEKRRRWNIGENLFPPPILTDLFYAKDTIIDFIPSSLWSILVPLLFISIPDRYSRSLIAAVFAPLIARAHGYCTPQTAACIVWATFLGGMVWRVAERMTERWWLPSSLPSPLFLSIPLLLSISRPHLLPLLPISYLMGKQLAKCRDSFGLTATALSAAFFYTGGGNSLATVDIAVGYAGLSEYQEWIVGAQIVLNAYAPCLCVLAGFLSESDSSKVVHDLCKEWMLRRAVSLLGCQLSLFIFRSHLFVWSVFAPRFLFEAVHLTVTVLMTACWWITGR